MNYFVRLVPRPLTRAKDFFRGLLIRRYASKEARRNLLSRNLFSNEEEAACNFSAYIYTSGIWIIFHSSISLSSSNTQFTILGGRTRGERDFVARYGRWVTARQVFRDRININGGLWGVLRKSIVRQVAIARRVRLDHVISRGCRQRQMTQLPFHGILPPPLWITLHACFDVLGPRVKLPWYFSFGRRSSVMFLLSKRTVARLDGKYSFALLSLTSVLEERIGRSATTIVLSFNWNPQIKIGYVPRAIIFRRYIVFS